MSIGYMDLLKIAECDYKACKAMEGFFPDEFAVRTALYHLQQAVEKTLKALILYNGEYPAFTHDIGKLIEHCEKLGESFSEGAELVADSLTLWENQTRYDPFVKLSEKKYKIAKSFYEEARNKITLANEIAEEQQESNGMNMQ